MYYLLVYAQLLLLTPLLYRLLRRHRALVYAVTPVFLGCREIVALLGVALPQIQVLFPAWLLYYVLGLDWERVEVSAKKASSKLPILWILIMALQVAIGYFWLAFGDYNMATTQLKLSSMLTSCVVLLLVGLRSEWAKSILSCRFLVRLGDCSFGIYLCHMVVMGAIGKLLGLLVLPMVMKTILMTILTLGVSYLVVSLAMRILPHGVCRVLGFV